MNQSICLDMAAGEAAYIYPQHDANVIMSMTMKDDEGQYVDPLDLITIECSEDDKGRTAWKITAVEDVKGTFFLEEGYPVWPDGPKKIGGGVDDGAPVANDDSETTPFETPVIIDLLGNDEPGDFPLDPATVSEDTPPANGTITINPDGTIEYTPDPGFSGEDTFVYCVSDTNGEKVTATVTVTVEPEPENLPPFIDEDDQINDQESFVGDEIDMSIDKAQDSDGTIVDVSADILPPDLVLAPSAAGPWTLSGTLASGAEIGGPAADGVYPITLTYTDDDGATVECPFTWTVTVETFNFIEEGGDPDVDITDTIKDVIANGGTIVINGVVLTDPDQSQIDAVITAAGGTITGPCVWSGAPDIPVCTVITKVCGQKVALEGSQTFANTVTETSNDGNGGGTWELVYDSMTICMTFTQTSQGATQGIVELQNQNRQVGIGGFLGTPLDPPAKTAVEYDVTFEIKDRREINGCKNEYDIFAQVWLMETLDTTAEFSDAFLFNPGDFITQNGQTFIRNETNGTAGEVFFMWKTAGIAANEGTSTNLTGGADRPVLGDGPFDLKLTLSDPVRFDFRPIERLAVEITKCGDTFISAEGADGNSYAEGDVFEVE